MLNCLEFMEDEMKVLIIAIGKCRKNSPEAQIIAEYIKRSGWEVVIKEKDNATQAEEQNFAGIHSRRSQSYCS